MAEKVFCENCREFVEYEIKLEPIEVEFKGKKYTVDEELAYCKSCGREVFVEELEDRNLKRFYKSFREKENIITLEKIKEIEKIYNLPKKTFSKSLGWEEDRFSRYLEGYLPDKNYSEILKRIHESPIEFKKILIENRTHLAEMEFERIINITENLIKKLESTDKISEAAKFLINHSGDISLLNLQKGLYYAQAWYMVFNRENLFEDDCEAWTFGPVYREIYNKYKNYDLLRKRDSESYKLSPKEIAILQTIAKDIYIFGEESSKDTSYIEEPWLKARGDLKPLVKSDNIIEKEWIFEYFNKIKEKYNIKETEDIIKYSKDIFKK